VRKGRLKAITEDQTELNDVKRMKEESEVRRLTSFERFICERENLALESLIYLEAVNRF